MSNNIIKLIPEYSKLLFLKLHVVNQVSTNAKSIKLQNWMSGASSTDLKATFFPLDVEVREGIWLLYNSKFV